MKIATLCALVGAASATTAAVTPPAKTTAVTPFCKYLSSQMKTITEGYARYEMQRKYIVNGCDGPVGTPQRCEKLRDDQNKSGEYQNKCFHLPRDKQQDCFKSDPYAKANEEYNTLHCQFVHAPPITPAELGINVEKPDSNNGEISVTYDWKKAEQNNEKWNHFWHHESQEPEVREIADHLNKAAKKMMNDVAGGQIAVVKNLGKLAGAFAQWAEPGSECDAEAFVTCLQGERDGGAFNPKHEVRHAFRGECAKHTDCEMQNWRERRPYEHEGKHDIHKAKHALKHMAREMEHDFEREMRDQRHNAEQVANDYLKECRERFTAWGCEPKCTDDHTRHLRALKGMWKCHCPASITVSGDTSVIMQ